MGWKHPAELSSSSYFKGCLSFLLVTQISCSAKDDLAWYSPLTNPGNPVPNPSLTPIIAETAINYCQLAPDVGPCDRELIRYYYDPESDECKKFIFSGCGGNSNRFMRRTHCRNSCVKGHKRDEEPEEMAEMKHRRTLTTSAISTPSPAPEVETSTSTTTSTTVTTTKNHFDTVSPEKFFECGDCDPIYGACVNGECGCIDGFKKLGRICVDINECDDRSKCPSHSRCVNIVGSYKCECDNGFSVNGSCTIRSEACDDEFDVNLTEEDCNDGHQEIRWEKNKKIINFFQIFLDTIFDAENGACKQFFYGGCTSNSKNFFADLQTCDLLCSSKAVKKNQIHGPLPGMPIEAVKELPQEQETPEESPGTTVNSEKPTIPKQRLDINLNESVTPSHEAKIEEAEKAESIVKEITPDHNACEQEFDEVFREECLSATWTEFFYWSSELMDCDAFWYDSSCDPRDRVGRNIFVNYETCKQSCDVGSSTPTSSHAPKVETKPTAGTEVEKTTIRDADGWSPVKPTVVGEFVDFEPSTSKIREDFPTVASDVESFLPNRNEATNYLEDELIPMEPARNISSVDIKTTPKREKSEKPVEERKVEETDCTKEFNAHLRDECETASWEEQYYWNSQFKDCEAFWYDTSCGAPQYKDENLFPTWTECNEKCGKPKPQEIVKMETSTIPTTEASKPTNPTAKEEKVKASSAPTLVLNMTELPYGMKNPLNIILKEALNPNKESALPEVLPPKHRQEFSNFAQKSINTATTKFDRLKYMAEFKKRLMEHPGGSTASFEKRPRIVFTLAPHVFEETTTLPTTTTTEKSTTSTYKPEDFTIEYIEAEKQKIEQTLADLDRPADFCEEPLHPKLEEDCSNDHWEVKWFFNVDRRACKSFWYGGCKVESRNFFPDHANCKAKCGHKYEKDNMSQPKSFAPPGLFSTAPTLSKNRLSTNLKLTFQNPENLFPPTDTSNMIEIDASLPTYPVITRKEPMTSKTIPKTKHVVTMSPNSKVEQHFFYDHVDKVFTDIKTKHRETEADYVKYEVFNEPYGLTTKKPDQTSALPSLEPEKVSFEAHDRAVTSPDSKKVVPKVLDTVPSPDPNQIVPFTPTSSTKLMKTTKSVADPCDDDYDPKWDEDCLGDQWVVRSYYDSKTASCKAFWYGGCITSSRNLWFDKKSCVISCAHKFPTVSSLLQEAGHGEKPEEATQGTQPTEQHSAESSTSPHTARTEQRFQSDLQRKLADVKREHEARQDLDYSRKVDSPVTVAAECLQSFDLGLAKTCNGGKNWTNRFYFDQNLRACRMYWNDGCFSSSPNNFDDLETCQWKCEGRHPNRAGKSCLDKFDQAYMEDCRHGEYSTRFYFDHDRKKCVSFSWGGCQSKSQNFYTDMGYCQELCESPSRELTQSCIHPFDEAYLKSCDLENYHQQYYYFDIISGTCKMFWFGNCRGENPNIFPSLDSCQWICERKREEKSPAYCADKFDVKYMESCGDGTWSEKWFFEQNTGECVSFWWDGCTSTSQNIFTDEKSCTSHCQHPGFEIASRLPDPETKYRCLEPVEMGSCKENYPAFYYDRSAKICRPFAYSGCGGNGNRFMTLSQCENLCYAFNHMTDPEMDCHLPLHIGYGKNDEQCMPHAGFRFYYDRDYGRCSQTWYLGCGGNANNFFSFELCQRTCAADSRTGLERKPRASSHVCFEGPGDKGKCFGNSSRPVQRWTYSSQFKCVQFSYSGCGGNDNRFATQADCEETCDGLRNSLDPNICSYRPDWGSCNQLRYMWFYNQSRASCDQFLYGGCEGNPNRFETFEICQKTCEISGIDPCLESLDRGSWCEAMSNRYYFNKRSRQCKGFHYTGCGKSGNNFLTKEECQQKCEKRLPRALPQERKKGKAGKAKATGGYKGTRPVEKAPMLRHVQLNGANVTYFKSDPEWMTYEFCTGYRYNVTGQYTVLHVHFCSMDGGQNCISESYGTTLGEEFCNVVRPFLRGQNLYSWYFGLDVKDPPYNGDGSTGRIQRAQETDASIFVLKSNNCHDIC
ncbi:unnamed protein product [Caenorhabditis auriculariae]|uniref:Uncharacterized protein n=1 Tax=Caenorhabditis auriculariae TaxID=2777116 RepID=A0A8S1HAQ7_9PELO|nr:unnamed protein product [Caenorhabditis auriculariae]